MNSSAIILSVAYLFQLNTGPNWPFKQNKGSKWPGTKGPIPDQMGLGPKGLTTLSPRAFWRSLLFLGHNLILKMTHWPVGIQSHSRKQGCFAKDSTWITSYLQMGTCSLQMVSDHLTLRTRLWVCGAVMSQLQIPTG